MRDTMLSLLSEVRRRENKTAHLGQHSQSIKLLGDSYCTRTSLFKKT